MINWQRLIKILLSVSFIIWPVSLVFSSLDIGDYGILPGINPLFFIALTLFIISALLTILINIKFINPFFMILAINIMFFSLMLVIEGTPRFTYNYHAFSNTDYILQNGHFDWDEIKYQSWPCVFIFSSVFINILGVGAINTMMWLPMMINLLLIPVLYLLFKILSKSSKIAWLGVALLSVFFWGAPSYLLPGVMGTFFSIFIIFLFLRSKKNEIKNDYHITTLILIFVIALVISHLLTTFFLIMTITLFLLSEWILTKKRPSSLLPVLITTICFSYLIYAIGSYSFGIITGTINNLFNYEATTNQVFRMGYGGSGEHSVVVTIRIISAASLAIFALCGYLVDIYNDKKINYNNSIIPAWVVSGSLFALITSYSGEIVSRIFSFTFYPMIISSVKLTKNKIGCLVLIGLFITSPFLSIVNSYGNEMTDFVSKEEINNVNMFSEPQFYNSTIFTLGGRIWGYHDSDRYVRVGYLDANINAANEKSFFLVGERDINSAIFLTRNDPRVSYVCSMKYNYSYYAIYSSDNIIIEKLN